MKRIHCGWLAFVAATFALLASAQDSAPADGQGWTGLAKPMDIIAARQALMIATETLMRPIDTYTVDPSEDPAVLRSSAETVAAMMLAVPHLFPPTTDLYDPQAELPETLALPAIWEDFPVFYTMATAASTAATDLAGTRDPDELRTASLDLRATCDACHALYLRPYVRSTVTEEDLDFDFDSLFEPN